ncbi:aldolase catalytic domain-containing protein [Desulforhopalus sp. 52FAK]
MDQKHKIQILDCTLRDGGYLNNWYFDLKMVKGVYRALSKAGVDIIEIGFRGTEKYFSREEFGAWRFSEDDLISHVISGIKGPQIAVMGDYNKIDIDDFAEANDSPVDIVRLAVHKTDLAPCISLGERIKEKGYEVTIQAMGYANYTLQERRDLASRFKDSNLNVLYVADSYGSMLPDQIESLFENLLDIPNVQLGFHPHNNLQMAFANTLEAIKHGASIIDATLNGIGRGAGNLPLEVILLYMEMKNKGTYNILPILNCVDTYLTPLQDEIEWGYQLPYMLSGMYQCHGSYAKNLLDLRQFNIEDICVAMERIKEINPVGYSKQVLNHIVSEGIIGHTKSDGTKGTQKKNEPIPYLDRHKGRDFLILANGPTLVEHKEKIDQFIKKYDPIVIGANNLSGLFEPDYHVFNNKRRFEMYIDTVSSNSNILLSQYFTDDMIGEYTERSYEYLYYLDRMDYEFDIIEGTIQSNCRTISVLLLGLSIVMGANKLFIVGLDGYLEPHNRQLHYYKESVVQTNESLLADLHHECLDFITQIDLYLKQKGKDGIEILTPTTYHQFYKGFDLFI